MCSKLYLSREHNNKASVGTSFDIVPIDLVIVLDVNGGMKVPINSYKVFWKSLEIIVK